MKNIGKPLVSLPGSLGSREPLGTLPWQMRDRAPLVSLPGNLGGRAALVGNLWPHYLGGWVALSVFDAANALSRNYRSYLTQ